MKSERTGTAIVRKAGQAALTAAAVFMLGGQPGTAAAGDRHNHERQASDRSDDRYESKFYGTVERLPKDLVGVWIVNGREIVVDKDTRIKEKHGRAEVGVYVKIEGFNREKSFVAAEIEVKQARQGR